MGRPLFGLNFSKIEKEIKYDRNSKVTQILVVHEYQFLTTGCGGRHGAGYTCSPHASNNATTSSPTQERLSDASEARECRLQFSRICF